MNYVKTIAAVMIAAFSFQYVSAQNNYVIHTLKQGESLSALAQEYNTSVGDIMRINGMHADTKLVYGSQIKIPSTQKQVSAKKVTTNTAATTTKISAPQSNEITHVVTKGETLYSISKKYNVSVDQLKSWNHLADNSTKIGTLLIISNKGNDKLATTPSQKQRVETVETTEQKKEPVANTENIKAEDNDVKTQPVLQTGDNTSSITAAPVIDYSGEGFFASQFKERKTKNKQNISGISKTFKTSSGWTDGKYYILANDIEPGTIVKITADNGSAVYAKVLWNMGDLKENTGINFRVSNATAAALHVNDASFNLNVSF